MINQLVKRVLGRPEIEQIRLSTARIEVQSKVSTALSRAALTRSLRDIDETCPGSWEFSAFCQHGEDGIIDFICGKLFKPNHFFVEIGAGDGTQNNSAWLAFARDYDGLMIDRDEALIESARSGLQALNYGVQYICETVDADNVCALLKRCPFADPDVFSIDIDGVDYYLARKLLESGFRPRIIVAEYNSAFGDTAEITIPYKNEFVRFREHSSGLYYGVSVAAWRKLFAEYGYNFVTVNSSGVNAFFVRPECVPAEWLQNLSGVDFRMNVKDQNSANVPKRNPNGELVLRRLNWQEQFAMISQLPFVQL